MADAMKLVEVIETLEALTKSTGADEFDKGARAARLDALDMLRPLAASPPAREEAPAEGAGDAWKPLYDRHGYLNDPEGLARIRSGLLEVKDWHDLPGAIVNCNSLARLLDTIAALRNRTSEPEAGAVAWRWRPSKAHPLFAEYPSLGWKTANDRSKLDAARLPDEWFDVQPLYTRPAPAPDPATADKLKVAVEALEKADAAARSGAAMCAADYHITTEKLGEAIYTITTPALAALNEQPQ